MYLVAVSATGEPVSVLRLQLDLLHAQIVCILTEGFHRMFARNPRYDSRRLLGTALSLAYTLAAHEARVAGHMQLILLVTPIQLA